eukprot:scaffold4271_cov96-Cylindrotheca_fusiformis.AAC.2
MAGNVTMALAERPARKLLSLMVESASVLVVGVGRAPIVGITTTVGGVKTYRKRALVGATYDAMPRSILPKEEYRYAEIGSKRRF